MKRGMHRADAMREGRAKQELPRIVDYNDTR